MKVLVLSDIHANIYALETIWRKETGCDQILCAGDLVDYGPYPREVLDWVRAHPVTCVQGNHDAWVAQVYRRGETLETVPEADRTWANLNAGLISAADAQFLESLPKTLAFDLEGVSYGLSHMYRDYNEIVSLPAFRQFAAEAFDSSGPGDMAQREISRRDVSRLILGHTHRQAVRYLADDVLWLNPGSASYRRLDDPDPAAHYATITDGKISLKRVDYNRAPLYRFLDGLQLKESELEVARFFFGPR